jgi:hypothetical protein
MEQPEGVSNREAGLRDLLAMLKALSIRRI